MSVHQDRVLTCPAIAKKWRELYGKDITHVELVRQIEMIAGIKNKEAIIVVKDAISQGLFIDRISFLEVVKK